MVYLIHAADGIIPSNMAESEADYEEERRLLYMGLTRARNRLCVTFPLRYFHCQNSMADTYGTAQMSRFLPSEVHFLFKNLSFCPKKSNLTAPKSGQTLSANVRAQIRKMWK